MRETERKDKEVCGLFSTPQLSPPWHPRDQAAWLSCQNSKVFLQQQGKICTWKENPVLPLPPSLGWRKQGVCCSLGVCALAAHPSPSPTFHSHPLPDGIPQPSPSLVSRLPPGIPCAQPFGEVPTPLQGSCLPLTVGKAHEPLPSLTFLALACICHLP